MVAKSYQSLEILGEPFVSNGRWYVNVLTKKGTPKQVRWYSEKEYQRMYPDEKVQTDSIIRINQKKILGFEKGYITIFKGNTYEEKEYFQMSSARYCKFWGWYFISTEEIPDDLPEDVEPIRLPWELVGQEDNTLKSDDQVRIAVESLIYDDDDSVFIGEIGERLELVLTVEKAIPLEGYYGNSTMHVMRDYDGNCFIWTTAAKSWEPETEHHLVGTVKEHKTYRNVKQTILTRCRELTD